MASTQLSDVIIPDVYLSYTSDNSPEKSVLVEAGVAVKSELFDELVTGRGMLTEIPAWRDLDATIEPNYSTDNPADVAIPQKVGASVMQCRRAFLNQGWSAADLVTEIAGSNPMQQVRNRTGVYWMRVFQRRILAIMQGVRLANVANNSGDMTIDLSIPAGLSAGAANLFTRSAFTAAAFTMGDMSDAITAIAVHSVVFKRMVDNDDIAFVKPSVGTTDIPTFLGRRVLVDDTMPVEAGGTNGFVYTSFFFGAGAFAYGEGEPQVPLEVYRRPDEGNGGGVEQMWERRNWLIHPFGHTFTNNTVSGQSATVANLKLAANWQRVYERKNVPLAFLRTNG